MVKYFDELKRAMEYLGEQEDTVFLGQAVAYKGTAMSNTLKDIGSHWKGANKCLSTMEFSYSCCQSVNQPLGPYANVYSR